MLDSTCAPLAVTNVRFGALGSGFSSSFSATSYVSSTIDAPESKMKGARNVSLRTTGRCGVPLELSNLIDAPFTSLRRSRSVSSSFLNRSVGPRRNGIDAPFADLGQRGRHIVIGGEPRHIFQPRHRSAAASFSTSVVNESVGSISSSSRLLLLLNRLLAVVQLPADRVDLARLLVVCAIRVLVDAGEDVRLVVVSFVERLDGCDGGAIVPFQRGPIDAVAIWALFSASRIVRTRARRFASTSRR